MWQYWSHLKYTIRHRHYVMTECAKEGLIVRGLLHDMSKFTIHEFIGYANFFFDEHGVKKVDTDINSNEVKEEFNKAFKHHYLSNDHHWKYYITEGKGVKIVREMPHDAAIEMICDWKGAAKANYENEPDIPLPWYKKNRSRILLHTETRKFIEEKIGFKN